MPGLADRRRLWALAVGRRFPPVLALATMLIAAVAAYSAGTAADAGDQLEFQRAVQAVQRSVESRLAAYVAMLRAGTGLFAAHPTVSRAEFAAYVDRLDLAGEYPGTRGIGFTVRLRPDEVPAAIAAMRAEGHTGFRIWPEDPRDEYHAIVYLEPLDERNQAAIGYDMFTEPVRRAAMERARDTGDPAASSVVTLVQEIDEIKQPGFLIYVPVYWAGGTPPTVEERRRGLRGFVYSPFRTHDLLRGILGFHLEEGLHLAIYDGREPADARLLYRTEPEPRRTRFSATAAIDVAGRPWTLAFSAPAPLVSTGQALALAILLAGAVVSGLLLAMTRAQVRAREAAERAEDEAEALFDLGNLLGETLEPGLLGQRVVESVRRLLGGEMAVLYRADPRTGDLHLLAGVGPRVDWNRVLARGTATVGRAVAERRPVATADLLDDPRVTLEPEARARIERSGYRAVLAVPLLLEDRVFGGLAVGDRAGRTFSADETRLLQTFAQTAVLSLENARLYDEERAARREAELASRAKDEFLAILSHELRTPLTAMFGWIRLLRGGQLPPDRQEHALAVVERNTHLQAQLIDDLLDVSRIVSGKLELDRRPVDLAGVVEESVEAVRREAEAKPLELRVALDPAGALVSGDARRLQQVTVNLLTNAVKYTPPGGRVEVRLEAGSGAARLTVADTGRGIAPELLPFVFDPFWQAEGATKRGQAGLGLGLAIVRSLVQLHGGEVTARSDGPGRGAVFTVTLPVLAVRTERIMREPAAAEAAPAAAGRTALAGLRLLVVDDHADSRDLVRALLEAAGARVHTAGSVGEALGCLQKEPVDVVVTDLGMPEVDGYDFIRLLRRREEETRARPTPIVALTAFAGARDRDRALAAGFQAHVAKPVEPGRLVQVVTEVAQAAP
jgi:signal transduction histidine kinase/ActR/RegA family two-component response regulator